VLRIARTFGVAARVVVLATGEAGRAVRLLGPLLAAPVAYAAWERDRAAAPGQHTPEELRGLIGHLRGAPRRVFAVLGRPVGGSLSPRMHNAAYRVSASEDLMVPIQVRDGGELLRLAQPSGLTALDGLGFSVAGFAVTMPWKEDAVACCTLVAPRALRARAVNTVLPRRGKVLGDCTDIDGIVRALVEAGARLEGARALVLGTGGSARAAVVALHSAGCAVAVAGRDRGKTRAMAASLGAAAITPAEAGRCTVAVNATPVGADHSPSEFLDALRLAPGSMVVDLPYGPAPTRMQVLAEQNTWSYVGGREVLLWQGVAQFAAMTGSAPPVQAMASALGLVAGEMV
jgi:3-dehydroquinate dehydratase/shikimate dehydrogenase